jgi:sporulation protein YlmC with PRC-barrel domain
MKHFLVTGPFTVGVFLCLAGPLGAAQLATDAAPQPSNPTDVKAAQQCLKDLSAFDSQRNKDGYWHDDAGLGYRYPMDGQPAASTTGYRNVRPSYELRTLIASANILAQRGNQQGCEDTLTTIRDVYKTYVADMRGNGAVADIDDPSRQQQQIAAAQPVTAGHRSFTSDQLIGKDVRNAKDETLGSVHDFVTNPSTGAIAYLVIGRGGFLGIDEKYVPVPWGDFKVTQNMRLLVLDIPKTAMDKAPEVTDDQFTAPGKFDQESQKVDAYWKTQLSSN